MNYKKEILILFIFILILGVTSMTACGFLGFGGTEKWKEEVQLSDGRIIVVEREMLTEGGGGEWVSNRSGRKPKEDRIRFTHPDGSGKLIEWKSIKEYRTYPEIPLILDLESGQPVIFSIVYISDGCQIYSKYRYRNGVWIEEALTKQFEKRTTNLFLKLSVDMPKFVDLETKRRENADLGYRQSLRQVGPNRQVCG